MKQAQDDHLWCSNKRQAATPPTLTFGQHAGLCLKTPQQQQAERQRASEDGANGLEGPSSQEDARGVCHSAAVVPAHLEHLGILGAAAKGGSSYTFQH
jgi:hypothetical protein